MTNKFPILTLSNGVSLPGLGLGVYRSRPENTLDAVSVALNTGYRLIDTAAAYGNEAEGGEVVVSLVFKEGGAFELGADGHRLKDLDDGEETAEEISCGHEVWQKIDLRLCV